MPWSYPTMLFIFDVLYDAFHGIQERLRPSDSNDDSSSESSAESTNNSNPSRIFSLHPAARAGHSRSRDADAVDSSNPSRIGDLDAEIAMQVIDEIAEQGSHRAGIRPRILRRVHPENGLARQLAAHQHRVAFQTGQYR